MKLRNSVNGNVAFEGDRTFKWRAIPANAKVLSAIAKITPVESTPGNAFLELLTFKDGSGDFGATKADGTAANRPWVEVDFHKRRTLARVTGEFGAITSPDVGGCTLQVDVGGGTYVEINPNGAFKTPNDPPNSFFTLEGNAADLPGLTVAKLKATSRTATPPLLTTLLVRSVPTQVSLRVGDLPPFFTHAGEMTSAETTPNFAAVLQAALTTAQIENGFYDLPITVHSDSIARLKIDLEIEVLAQQDVLPEAVREIALPFDVSTLSNSKAAELSIKVPSNSRVVAAQTSARVRGSFTETRIAFGPTGVDKPTAAVEVSTAYSQAQVFSVENERSPIAIDHEVSAVAVDLLLESLTPSARLQLDIRGDFDGKPDEIPLLPQPVEFRIEQQAGKSATWTSVPLPSEFLFAKAQDTPSRYWLLVQSLEGTAAWSVVEVPKGDLKGASDSTNSEVLNVQRTRDGGLSWQEAPLMPDSLRNKETKVTPPFIALFRLRDKPKSFKMPIRLEIGSGDEAVPKTLERFEPLGRVDFTLDTELADGINEFLATSAATVPETEHLLNADFEKWSRIGDEPIPQPSVSLRAPADAVAFSPDGTLAYVLDQGKEPFLLIVDVACNKELTEKAIGLAPLQSPRALVISPDGTRAYAINAASLRVVDLIANQTAAGVFSLDLEQEEQGAHDLAISPDGRFLYIANLRTVVSGGPTTKFNRIRVIDTARLEQQLTSGDVQAGVQTTHDVSTDLSQIQSPPAVATSPDGTVLYLVIDRGTGGNGLVTRVDTNTFALKGANLPVGPEPNSIAVAPNGARVVVANAGTANALTIIDPGTDTVVPMPLADAPSDVAISADAARAYVLFRKDPNSIGIIDVNRRIVVKAFDAQPNDGLVRSILALAPAEDHIYALLANRPSMFSVQLGRRLPVEWQITSGEVLPVCLPSPFHQVAVLGSPTLPTSISQVVPVAQSVAYEFHFWGIAVEPQTDEPPAIAEVLWLNSACGLLQTDSIPIEMVDFDGDVQLREFLRFAGIAGEQRAPLVFHRLTTRKVNSEIQPLTAPAGAEQAEVRFTVGKTAGAAIDLVSLSATSEQTANGDFKQQKDGRLEGWTLVPEMPLGFTVVSTAEGIQLINAGADTVQLIQTVAAKSEEPFSIEFQGKATSTTSSENPHIALHWLKADGSVVGEPTKLQILATGLDAASAGGTVPRDTTQVEIHLVVPAKTTLEAERVSLQYPRTTIVPVKFVSESPGDLSVSDVRIAFETIEPEAPPIPGRGLCTATAPGREPGQKGDSCYCHTCEEETVMTEMEPVTTEEGRPATKARCSTCRNEVLQAGGPLVSGAEALALRQTAGAQPMIVTPAIASPIAPPLGGAAATPQLTDIRGIGAARARQLTEIGIDSVEKLAASTTENVAKIKFITTTVASQIISEAKSRLSQS
ncbi:MAG: helix-hairpin-helix domain-containing protein [Pyrinomonadaceae bacterium]